MPGVWIRHLQRASDDQTQYADRSAVGGAPGPGRALPGPVELFGAQSLASTPGTTSHPSASSQRGGDTRGPGAARQSGCLAQPGDRRRTGIGIRRHQRCGRQPDLLCLALCAYDCRGRQHQPLDLYSDPPGAVPAQPDQPSLHSAGHTRQLSEIAPPSRGRRGPRRAGGRDRRIAESRETRCAALVAGPDWVAPATPALVFRS